MAMLITSFVCVAVISISLVLSDTKSSDDYVPCDTRWYYFRNKCYRSGGLQEHERLSWTRALARCKNYGADLVSIHSQEEQDFVVAFLQLRVKWSSWIGLNDRDTQKDFKWTDGSDFNYSNWNTKEPSFKNGNEIEDCVHMLLFSSDGEIGKWNDISCELKFAYICQKKPNHRNKSPNMMYCSSEEGGGWKYQTSCFHVVQEEQSWQNAESHCRFNYNGHLLTIRDKVEDYFLELALPDIKKEMWIGIKIKNQLQQKWTSNWYVSYERFNKEEKYEEGTCVARKNRTEWITTTCSSFLPFICEISRESPPVLNQPPNGAHCPKDLSDWRDLGGEYCYYIENTKKVNHYEALFDCKRRGGELASLHSQDESDILHPFLIDRKISYFFIGLIRILAFNEENFAWLDGSKLDYQNWGANEPNEVSNCVHVYHSSMSWYATNLPGNNDYGYICSVKKILPKSIIEDENARCINYCIPPYSHLHGLLSQYPDAKQISCKK